MANGKKITINSTTFASRWKTGMNNASQTIQDGVNAVTEAPGQKAAAVADLWVQNTTNAKNKWATNVASVTLSDWKNSMIKKGIPALTNAVALAEPKVKSAADKLIPNINSLVDTLPARGATLSQNLERVRHMAAGLQAAYSS
ncbi:MAG: hypothetical protein GYA36_15995 [Veillonellaceae bacterium]|nr:hypothetical protein [Veillonellaceae bacterium]